MSRRALILAIVVGFAGTMAACGRRGPLERPKAEKTGADGTKPDDTTKDGNKPKG
ncbi:MAG TPA: hypothetical protein VE631_10645 [Alphaproteobacteria bacterium]|jgi:predicted small lipoprotein YifL|nr:hypothetical protein [Alphaproteobacteria bacterium]